MSNLIVGQYTKNIGGIIIYQTPRSISDNMFPKVDLFLENTVGSTGNYKSVYYDLDGEPHHEGYGDSGYFKIVNITPETRKSYKRIMAYHELYMAGTSEERDFSAKEANKIAKNMVGFRTHEYAEKGAPISIDSFFGTKNTSKTPLMDKEVIFQKILDYAKEKKACIFSGSDVDVQLFAIKFNVVSPEDILFDEKCRRLFKGLNFPGGRNMTKISALAECISYNKDLFYFCKPWLNQ